MFVFFIILDVNLFTSLDFFFCSFKILAGMTKWLFLWGLFGDFISGREEAAPPFLWRNDEGNHTWHTFRRQPFRMAPFFCGPEHFRRRFSSGFGWAPAPHYPPLKLQPLPEMRRREMIFLYCVCQYLFLFFIRFHSFVDVNPFVDNSFSSLALEQPLHIYLLNAFSQVFPFLTAFPVPAYFLVYQLICTFYSPSFRFTVFPLSVHMPFLSFIPYPHFTYSFEFLWPVMSGELGIISGSIILYYFTL